MGLVVASAVIDLDGFSPVRGAQPREEEGARFSNVLAVRLGPAGSRQGPSQGNEARAGQGTGSALPGEDLEADQAGTEERQLPPAVAGWVAISPLFDAPGNPGSPASEAGAGEVQASLLEAPAQGAALTAAVTAGMPPSALADEMGVEAVVADTPALQADGAVSAPAGEPLPADPAGVAPVEDGDAPAVIDLIDVESPPALPLEIAPPGAAVDDGIEDALPPPAIDAAAEGMPAPGRHVEQSNRPANLPAGAAEKAVEALQRVAEKHQEAAKAPPGHSPGGNGMPAIAASVVRPVGNAETDTTADRGGQGGNTPPDGAMPVALATGNAPTAAPDAAPAPLTAAGTIPAAPEPPIDQVGRAVIEQVSEGGGEVHIRLDPPELGEVAIRVRIENHQVRVDIRVERPEALQLLRSAQLDLSSLLGERGLNLSDMFTTLDQGQSSWAGDPGTEGRAPSSDEGFAAVLGIDDAPAALNHHRKLQGAYNPDGAYIYRV